MGKLERIPDEEIERLLNGDSDDQDLDDLRRLLAELRAWRDNDVAESVVLSHVDQAVTASLRPGTGSRRRVPLPSKHHVRLVRRPALIGFVSAIVLLLGMSGVAWAANSSKPGDSLYGIDRAFEAIGIGNGGNAERLSEIRALFIVGDLSKMLDHVTNVIPANDMGMESAAQALKAAAETVQQNGTTTSSETLTAVSELLSYLSVNLEGVDAAEIVNYAGHIRTRGFDPPDAGLTPADPSDPSGFREDG